MRKSEIICSLYDNLTRIRWP